MSAYRHVEIVGRGASSHTKKSVPSNFLRSQQDFLVIVLASVLHLSSLLRVQVELLFCRMHQPKILKIKQNITTSHWSCYLKPIVLSSYAILSRFTVSTLGHIGVYLKINIVLLKI